ncbi:MAG: hypothetical protein ABI367_14500 [Mucilaginibacter sp.]
MEHLSFSLNIAQLHVLSNASPDITVFMDRFFAPDTTYYRQLTYELQREFKQAGSPDITLITFDRVQYNITTGHGSFRIVLDINFTFGCEDVITKKTDQTSEWTFSVDMHHNTISFYSSPFAEGRSTADEF